MRIAVPDLISNSYIPAVAAVELGVIAEVADELDARAVVGDDHGVELVFPVGRSMDRLREGTVDFVAGAAHATLEAFPRWEGARLLGALARHMYWFLVVRADLGVPRGDVAGVAGLSIGAAPGVDLGLRRILHQEGMAVAGIEGGAGAPVSIVPVPGVESGSVSFGVNAAQALADGLLDGFWANGMGAEVAVRDGTGTVVLDVRRGDGPADARGYTFPALVTNQALLDERPLAAEVALRALVRTQARLRAEPELVTPMARRIFPPREAELLATLIERDVPYYDAAISATDIESLQRFARAVGLDAGQPRYEDVVATKLASLWTRSEER